MENLCYSFIEKAFMPADDFPMKKALAGIAVKKRKEDELKCSWMICF